MLETVKGKTQLILLAGGKGERFGGELPKQFVKIAGRTVIEHTIDQIEKSESIDSVIIVVNEKFYDYMNDLLLRNHFLKVRKIIIGGRTRQESSYAGLSACDEDTENVLFHDAIRPFVSGKIIEDVVRALDTYEAVDVAIECADTIIEIDDKNIIEDIPKRRYLRRGQTPQGFRKDVIEEAYRRYFADGSLEVTDDCGIVREYGLADIYVVEGSGQNIKLTYREDIYLADKLFQIRSMKSNTEREGVPEIYQVLKDRVGVIIGASGGIGADIQRLLEEKGCKAYGFSRKNGCDINNYRQIQSVLKQVCEREGRIDYVINAAGNLRIGKLENMSVREIEVLVGVDYTGAVKLTKASLPYLRQTKGSLILFASSSYTRGRAMYSIYSSSKAAIVNFVQAIAEETAEEGIRINVINPERTDTPMRRRNFGYEDPTTLLESRVVAETAIRAVLADFTGQVIDVRRDR